MIIATADLHLSDQSRDSYRHSFMEALPAILDRRKADACVIFGDLTEEKDRHSAWLVNKVIAHLCAIGRPTMVVQGNHDCINPDHPFFGFIGRIPDLTWIGSPCTADELGEPWASLLGDTLILPHTRDYKRDWEGLRLKGRNYIFAHNTFEGADGGFGRKMEGVPLSVFPKDALVVSGDVHVPQELGCVTYVGAPYHVDFGDSYYPRLLELVGQGLRSIKLDFPHKQLLEVSSIDDLDDYETLHEDDILKIRIKVQDYAQWPDIKARVMQWGKSNGFQIHAVLPVMKQRKVKQDLADNAPQTDKEVLQEYAERHGVDTATLKVGQRFVEEP